MTASADNLRSRYTSPKGISATNRRRLATLHAKLRGPFSAADAADALDVSPARARRLLSYLWSRGWLSRVRRGLYTTVPIDARRPGEWREEPWLVASEAFRPCYIAGWSAAEHWGLTDQVFREVAVVTARRVRRRRVRVQDTTFVLKVRAPDKLFGTTKVWLHDVPVSVSDLPRTIVDVLDDPGFGGGIKHVAEMLAEYARHERREDPLLVDYASRLGNRAVFKRLGYLVEALAIDAPELAEACLKNKSTGLALLDPGISSAGRIVRRWNIRANARVGTEE